MLLLALFLSLFSPIFAGSDSSTVIINNLSEIEHSYFYNAKTYLLGTVSPLPDSIKFNGHKALLKNSGAFLVYTDLIPVEEPQITSPVRTELLIELFKGNKVEKKRKFINIYYPSNNFPVDRIIIDSLNGIYPKGEYLLRSGEEIELKFRATPGCNAYFYINNDTTKIKLYENTKILNYDWGEGIFGSGTLKSNIDTLFGFYSSIVTVPDSLDSLTIKVHLEKENLTPVEFTLPANIHVMQSNASIVAITKKDPNLITARYGPGKGYKLFLQDSIPLNVTSIKNGWVQSDIGGNNDIYVPLNSVRLINDTNKITNAEIQMIRLQNGNSIDVVLEFSHRVPVEIKQLFNPTRYELYCYGVTSNIDWVKYEDVKQWVQSVEHYQISDDVLKVIINLRSKTHWGYALVYSQNNYVLKIKKPGKQNTGFIFGANQLENRKIVIDPGHSEDSGAVGPTGLAEKDINFIISSELKDALENRGAKVFLTRGENENLPLRSRKSRVNSFEPDISISVHNNAVPLTVNPLLHNGYSVYYYYPQALPLAEKIYKNFGEKLGLPDFGFYWDNLYMCRITETIALLVEPTFIIHPDHEELLKDKQFREKIIEAIVESIDDFFEEYAE